MSIYGLHRGLKSYSPDVRTNVHDHRAKAAHVFFPSLRKQLGLDYPIERQQRLTSDALQRTPAKSVYSGGSRPMHEKSIELLNKAVADELAAVHQYMYFHFHCDDQGFDLLAGMFRRTAIEEMIHVEKLAERILFLKGEVEMKPAGEVDKIHDVGKMLEMGAKMEEGSAHDYNRWANECAQNADAISKRLFEDLVSDEERHYDQFDTEMANMKKFGEKYLALQSIERSKSQGNRPA